MPVRASLDNFEAVDFEVCAPFLGPMMYTVGLVWVHSNYYNTPERITVLLQMLCNYVIDMVTLDECSFFFHFIAYAVVAVCYLNHLFTVPTIMYVFPGCFFFFSKSVVCLCSCTV